MNDYELKDIKETFCRLFVLAVRYKMNLGAFTNALAKSDFISKIESGLYLDVAHKKVKTILFEISSNMVCEDISFGVYNDAYWCGEMYFDLHLKLHKSFAYLFLKLPFEKLIDMYPVYHEMDFSSLEEQFHHIEKEKTILRLLCEKHRCSLPKLSKATGISLNTLRRYNVADEYLYKGSFQSVIKIANYFDAPVNLFVE